MGRIAGSRYGSRILCRLVCRNSDGAAALSFQVDPSICRRYVHPMGNILRRHRDVRIADDIHLGTRRIPCIDAIGFTHFLRIIDFDINISVDIHGVGGLIHDAVQHHLVAPGHIHTQFSRAVDGECAAGGIFRIVNTSLIILGIGGNGIIPCKSIGESRFYPCIIGIGSPRNRFCKICRLRRASQKTGSQRKQYCPGQKARPSSPG